MILNSFSPVGWEDWGLAGRPLIPNGMPEFDHKRTAAQNTGHEPDPRTNRIERLQSQVATLRQRLSTKDSELAELREFRTGPCPR